jgi:FkbM family methyltransferase
MNSEFVFDIGANNGDDAAEYLNRGCRVVAVEANPALCVELRDRFASDISAGQLVLVDKAISPRHSVTLYVNSSDHGWGTILPSYAEHGARLRGTVTPVEVATITLIDLIRTYGVPNRVKIDIEGADIECIGSLLGADLPAHLSIERPKSLADQLLALALMRRIGYTRFAFVDQTPDSEIHSSTAGLFDDDLAPSAWTGLVGAALRSLQLHGIRAFGAAMRRIPGLRAVAPQARWHDIHADLSQRSVSLA